MTQMDYYPYCANLPSYFMQTTVHYGGHLLYKLGMLRVEVWAWYKSMQKPTTCNETKTASLAIFLKQETGIGRSVNRFKKNDGAIGETARHIISSWKQVSKILFLKPPTFTKAAMQRKQFPRIQSFWA